MGLFFYPYLTDIYNNAVDFNSCFVAILLGVGLYILRCQQCTCCLTCVLFMDKLFFRATILWMFYLALYFLLIMIYD